MTTFCILDSNGNVRTTFGCSQLPTAQTGYQEIAIDGGQVGQVWNGSAFDAGSVKVPQAVTMKQARLSLLNANMLTEANNAIAAMTGTAGQAAQIEWEFSPTVGRHDPLVTAIGPTLGLTDAQIDQLFIAAAAL